jgi:hypothetical protein
MKIPSNLETGNIYSIKLVTGEEIVTRVTHIDRDHDTIEIGHPILTVPGPQGLQMMPALFAADVNACQVYINTTAWVMIAPARTDIADAWIEATTGIKPATRRIITG